MVSVIIPVYNGSKYLRETVKTIAEQTYPSVEILLINDGSKDNSLELINKLADEYKNIVPIDKENGGVASARNYGLKHARGEFVAFCDQDDLWIPEKLARQVPLFSNPQTGLVYCGSVARYTELNKDVKPGFDHQFRGPVFERLVYENMFTCCTVIARKAAVEAVGGFDSDRALMGVDDWHIWLKLAREVEFDFVADHLAVHVFHGANYSSNEEKMHIAELVCIDKIESTMKGSKYLVDWRKVRANIHEKYAASYLYNGDYKLASKAFSDAAELVPNSKLKIKATLLGYLPRFFLGSMQGIKRSLSSHR